MYKHINLIIVNFLMVSMLKALRWLMGRDSETENDQGSVKETKDIDLEQGFCEVEKTKENDLATLGNNNPEELV